MNTLIKIGALTVPSEDWDVPTDRQFRDAWAISDVNSGVIEVDMDKAREIYKDKLREARDAEWKALDAAMMRALEDGSDKKKIIARKQELRDATDHPKIAAAKTPEDLLAIKPAGLEV